MTRTLAKTSSFCTAESFGIVLLSRYLYGPSSMVCKDSTGVLLISQHLNIIIIKIYNSLEQVSGK